MAPDIVMVTCAHERGVTAYDSGARGVAVRVISQVGEETTKVME